ncbi:MAG: hypothetical protein ACKV19_01160 [Verrucomicrobiales bacterium]
MEELVSRLKPGGIMVATFHGPYFERIIPEALLETFAKTGFCYSDLGKTPSLPDYYLTTFHSHPNIATAGAPGTGDVPSTIPADEGSGTLELVNAWNGLVDDFGGSTLNALNSDPAGASLSLIGAAGNGSAILITGLSFPDSDPVFVFFATRGTSTGFDGSTWEISIDGNSFSTISSPNTASRSTTYEQVSFEIPVAGFANAIIRYRLDGATSASGDNRMDNLLISTVPEPSVVLLGMLSLFGLRHRRR